MIMIMVHRRYGRTDGRMSYDSNMALCTMYIAR